MMEVAYKLENYLPLSFKSTAEEDYIAFLWDAFRTNCEHKKFQFAFLAYHMLTMAFVYFNVWQIRKHRATDFEKAMVGFDKDMEKHLLDATTPFAFWRVSESGVMRFMKLIGCDNGKCGTYAKLVRDRNETAHCNGNVFYSDDVSLESKMHEVMRVVDEIQVHSKGVIDDCYRMFLQDYHDTDEREYPDVADQIREVLIHQNYFSRQDLEFCARFDLRTFTGDLHWNAIAALHEGVCAYAKSIDEDLGK